MNQDGLYSYEGMDRDTCDVDKISHNYYEWG